MIFTGANKDILLYVLSFLDGEELLKLCVVNAYFKTLMDEHDFLFKNSLFKFAKVPKRQTVRNIYSTQWFSRKPCLWRKKVKTSWLEIDEKPLKSPLREVFTFIRAGGEGDLKAILGEDSPTQGHGYYTTALMSAVHDYRNINLVLFLMFLPVYRNSPALVKQALKNYGHGALQTALCWGLEDIIIFLVSVYMELNEPDFFYEAILPYSRETGAYHDFCDNTYMLNLIEIDAFGIFKYMWDIFNTINMYQSTNFQQSIILDFGYGGHLLLTEAMQYGRIDIAKLLLTSSAYHDKNFYFSVFQGPFEVNFRRQLFYKWRSESFQVLTLLWERAIYFDDPELIRSLGFFNQLSEMIISKSSKFGDVEQQLFKLLLDFFKPDFNKERELFYVAAKQHLGECTRYLVWNKEIKTKRQHQNHIVSGEIICSSDYTHVFQRTFFQASTKTTVSDSGIASLCFC